MHRSVLSLALCVLAGCGSSTPAQPAAPSAEAAAPPAVGEATISVDDLRAHVEELSSDEYAGRETLKEGYRKAAAYLAARFEQYGLQPLPGRSDFALPYTLLERGFLEEGTEVVLSRDGRELRLEPGVDFTPFHFSDPGEVEAEVVFAGYGITAPDLDYDDYGDLDVEGKLVLVLRHTPNEDDEESVFAGTSHAYFRTKARNAYEHGAAGMLLVTDPRHHQEADDLRLGASLRVPHAKKKKKKKKEKEKEGEGKSKGKEGQEERAFLAVHVSRDAAAHLLPEGTSLEAIQVALDEGEAPASEVSLAARARVSVRQQKEAVEVHPKNVVGFLPGSDPDLREEWVVLGAHYDHLGAFHGDGDTVYNGADDNASGTAAILELAEAFASLPERPKRSLVFIGFSGEEKGLLGSRALLSQELLPLEKVIYMLNLDMIGRNPERPLDVVGDGYATEVKRVTEEANRRLGLELSFGGTNYSGASDHHPFFVRSVPVTFFFTGLHDDYHQLGDHADKLAYERLEKIVRLGYGVTGAFASGEATPRFVHQVLWLGAEVQVLEDEGEPRAVVTGVEEDTRGARAGLKEGDVIVAFGDEPLEDPAEVGDRFRNLKPGTEITLRVRRGAESVEVPIERAKRGYLGVMPARVSADERKRNGLADDEGVKIARIVGDGPAGEAGMEEGDILIRIAGVPVGLRNLGRSLARIGAGETVHVVVVRDGERVSLELTLAERPER